MFGLKNVYSKYMVSIKNHLLINLVYRKSFQYVYKMPDCYVFVQEIKGGEKYIKGVKFYSTLVGCPPVS